MSYSRDFIIRPLVEIGYQQQMPKELFRDFARQCLIQIAEAEGINYEA